VITAAITAAIIVVVYIVIAAVLYIKMLAMSKTDEFIKYSNKLKLALSWPVLIVIFAMMLCKTND